MRANLEGANDEAHYFGFGWGRNILKYSKKHLMTEEWNERLKLEVGPENDDTLALALFAGGAPGDATQRGVAYVPLNSVQIEEKNDMNIDICHPRSGASLGSVSLRLRLFPTRSKGTFDSF